MTRKQRMLAAIRREPVDRIPHATYNIYPYPDNPHGNEPTYSEILARIEATAGASMKVSAGGGSVCLPPDCVETTVEGRGDDCITTRTLHTPNGDLVSIARSPENKPGMTLKHWVSTDEDIERYLSLPHEPHQVDLTRVRAMQDAVGDNGVVMVTYGEPMYAVAGLFNFDEFCMRCATDLPSIKRMIDWSFERCIEFVQRLAAACKGMDVCLHTSGPEVCTPPMLSPALFAELVTPSMQKIISVIHDAGLPAAIHCHGRVRDVLPEMIKTGADLLEPIEPPDQGDIALGELLDRCKGEMCVMGHVQDQEFYTAEPGHMTKWVEHLAKVAGGRTGYIMSPTCTPFEHPCSDIYRRNYLEWLDACDRILAV